MKQQHKALIVIAITLLFLCVLLLAKTNLDRRKALKKPVYTIVIDPGHRGNDGEDLGAHYGGIDEADLNDDIARLLQNELEKAGYEVYLSRELDVPCSFQNLDERVDFINGLQPDLIISIHHNAAGSNTERMRGYSVYYSSYKPQWDQDGIYVDFIEESYPFVEEVINEDDVSVIYYQDENTVQSVTDAETLYYVKDATPCDIATQSKYFAQCIDEQFSSETVLPPLSYGHYSSVMEADFRVLKNTDAPSAMIEVGYMSNADELQILSDPKEQKKTATALKKAIDAYFASYHDAES